MGRVIIKRFLSISEYAAFLSEEWIVPTTRIPKKVRQRINSLSLIKPKLKSFLSMSKRKKAKTITVTIELILIGIGIEPINTTGKIPLIRLIAVEKLTNLNYHNVKRQTVGILGKFTSGFVYTMLPFFQDLPWLCKLAQIHNWIFFQLNDKSVSLVSWFERWRWENFCL